MYQQASETSRYATTSAKRTPQGPHPEPSATRIGQNFNPHRRPPAGACNDEDVARYGLPQRAIPWCRFYLTKAEGCKIGDCRGSHDRMTWEEWTRTTTQFKNRYDHCRQLRAQGTIEFVYDYFRAPERISAAHAAGGTANLPANLRGFYQVGQNDDRVLPEFAAPQQPQVKETVVVEPLHNNAKPKAQAEERKILVDEDKKEELRALRAMKEKAATPTMKEMYENMIQERLKV